MMRTELVYSERYEHLGYGAGEGIVERLEYKCPCGKDRIIAKHDNIPGSHEHDIFIRCEECSKKYRIDRSKGAYNWQLIPNV